MCRSDTTLYHHQGAVAREKVPAHVSSHCNLGTMEAKEAVLMENGCILCGKKRTVGLHIGGFLLCFDCERKLLHADGYRIRRGRRRKLLHLYEA